MHIAVRPATEADRASIERLSASHLYSRFRGYDRLGFDLAGPETTRGALACLTPPALGVVAEDGDQVVGFLGVRPNEFETEVLGVGVGRATEPLADGDGQGRAAVVHALARGALEAWSHRGGSLLIVRVDADDQAGLVGCQQSGFVVLEGSTTYLNDHDLGPAHRHPDNPFSVTTYTHEQLDALAAIDISLLEAWTSKAYERDHFHADPRLDTAAADALYVRWLHHVFAGEWAEWVAVAWRDGEAVGYLSWNRAPELLTRYGLDVLMPSLGAAVAPQGTGSLGETTRVAATTRPLGARFMEWTTQLGNIGVHRVFARQASLNLFSTSFTMHGWTDGG
jgi:hypothetical protein